MTIDESISRDIIIYPELYYHETYEKARIAVLDQYFMTNGNGMHWENGSLLNNVHDIEYDHEKEDLRRYSTKHTLNKGNYKEVMSNLPMRVLNEYDIRTLHIMIASSEELLDDCVKDKCMDLDRAKERLDVIKALREKLACGREKITSTKMSLNLYPISKYSKIMNIPDNAREDHLEAAKEVLNYIIENRKSEWREEITIIQNRIKDLENSKL